VTPAPAWHTAEVAGLAPETDRGRRITLEVSDWPGNDAGQHLDIRLTAPDGYQASRSYSIATAGRGTAIELAVELVEGGEVSGFLVHDLLVGDRLEVRGPLGGWFVWRPEDEPSRPVQLIAGGSGVVPAAAMLRAHVATGSSTPMRLLHAVRSPALTFYGAEIDALAARDPAIGVDRVYSRAAPPDALQPAGRLTVDLLAELTVPADQRPRLFVCGSTPFVEQVLRWLAELGHAVDEARAERFGGAR
jgi:ferredoxin-NADP reductase